MRSHHGKLPLVTFFDIYGKVILSISMVLSSLVANFLIVFLIKFPVFNMNFRKVPKKTVALMWSLFSSLRFQSLNIVQLTEPRGFPIHSVRQLIRLFESFIGFFIVSYLNREFFNVSTRSPRYRFIIQSWTQQCLVNLG